MRCRSPRSSMWKSTCFASVSSRLSVASGRTDKRRFWPICSGWFRRSESEYFILLGVDVMYLLWDCVDARIWLLHLDWGNKEVSCGLLVCSERFVFGRLVLGILRIGGRWTTPPSLNVTKEYRGLHYRGMRANDREFDYACYSICVDWEPDRSNHYFEDSVKSVRDLEDGVISRRSIPISSNFFIPLKVSM